MEFSNTRLEEPECLLYIKTLGLKQRKPSPAGADDFRKEGEFYSLPLVKFSVVEGDRRITISFRLTLALQRPFWAQNQTTDYLMSKLGGNWYEDVICPLGAKDKPDNKYGQFELHAIYPRQSSLKTPERFIGHLFDAKAGRWHVPQRDLLQDLFGSSAGELALNKYGQLIANSHNWEFLLSLPCNNSR